MSDLKRLLFVTHNFPPILGGISVYSTKICSGLAQSGVEVKVLTSALPLETKPDDYEVINFREYASLHKARRVAVCAPLIKIIKQWKPDVIFAASQHPYGYFVHKVASLYRTPFVFGLHGSELWRLASSEVISKFERYMGVNAMNGANTVFCVSQYLADLSKKAAPGISAAVVIPNGVDTEQFTPGKIKRDDLSSKVGIDLDNKFVLVSVSSLVLHKGHSFVLQAISELRKTYPNIIYIIVGDGAYRKDLEKQSKSLDLTECVKFIGAVELSFVPNILKSSDLFILNCQKKPGEGFGIVFLEANACGLPVIAGNTGGVPDAVKDGETGILVDPENPEEIANAIEKLMTDAELQKTMGENGRKWAEELDWNNLIPRYKAALEEIVR